MIIKNLTVKKNDKTILNGLDVSFENGYSHVIMGPNGSGKSTLFSTIAGAEADEIQGEIRYKHMNLLEMETYKRALNGIHLSVQNPPVIEGLSNSVFLSEIVNARMKELGKPPVDALKMYKAVKHFSEKYNFPPDYYKKSFNDGLSGGEKKRNEILQIDLLEPDFVMLDEIDSGLDIEMMKNISKFLREYLVKKPTSTIVTITHYPVFAQLLKPKFVHILKGGKIVKTGDISLIQEVEENGFGGF